MASALSPSDLADRIRRDVGRSVLRAKNGIKFVTGIGRPDVGATPKDTVWTRDKVQLWRYQSENRRYRPPLLLIMSLVSRSYIFDLRPGSSMVEDFLAGGLDVFLLDWGIPDELDAGNTLETYCDEYMPRAVDAVCAEAGGGRRVHPRLLLRRHSVARLCGGPSRTAAAKPHFGGDPLRQLEGAGVPRSSQPGSPRAGRTLR